MALRVFCTALLPSVLLAGCISYTVGQGAETKPQGERSFGSTVNLVPGTLRDGTTSAPTRRPSVDTDFRFGLDDRSDVSFRIAAYMLGISRVAHDTMVRGLYA